jgi:hypothetical protein
MLKLISAIAALALLAGAAIILPSLGTKVEASTPPAAVKGDRLDIRPTGSACSQTAWPYYEAKCVRDRKQPAGPPRDVRIVSLDRLPIVT